MLFILTGEVQIGKTRWLTSLVDDLAVAGVACFGVLAPGVWEEKSESIVSAVSPGIPVGIDAGIDCATASKGASTNVSITEALVHKKIGIDNVLLPGGERISFGVRRDLVEGSNDLRPSLQSTSAKLAWVIPDEAIARVNAHFDTLAAANAKTLGALKTSPTTAFLSAAANAYVAPPLAASVRGAASSRGLLVIDELGRLELMHNQGLTSATALVDAGLSAACPHALIVVRSWLADQAAERFGARWQGVELITPGDEARRSVFAAYNLR